MAISAVKPCLLATRAPLPIVNVLEVHRSIDIDDMDDIGVGVSINVELRRKRGWSGKQSGKNILVCCLYDSSAEL